MDASVVVPVYNSEKTLKRCLDALTNQDFKGKWEIITVNDGSQDSSENIIKQYPQVNYVFQKNAGPAAARNKGWKQAKGKIVVFTDSDCVPEKDWLTEMTKPFNEDSVGAVGGVYNKTENGESELARLIGEEIKYRYSKMEKFIDAHGSYSLAVRKEILEKLKGFDEKFPNASTEDFDLCYRIVSEGYKIALNKNAKVGHYHPEVLSKYLKTQFRHGYYRMKLSRGFQVKNSGDKYSGNAKYQVVLSGMTMLGLIYSPLLWLGLVGLIYLQMDFYRYLIKNFDVWFGLKNVSLQLLRGYAWTWGIIKGVLNFYIFK